MNIPAEFDEIRPYLPEELPQIFEELIADPTFQDIMTRIIPDVPVEILCAKLRQCKTNLEVQKTFFHKLLHDIMDQHSDGFDMDTSSLNDKTRNYTFVSNHRDIVLDPGFLSVGLLDNGFPNTVEIAIGDNLLIFPWIKKLVRVNKAFIVQRTINRKQILESSMRMSRYIHFALTQKKENIWIAQREGRAKDSNDRTQESVLKMLAMGGEGDYVDRLKELNIVPTSLSYEYDPCDYLKAMEMQQKRDIEGFKKSQEDDLQNMQTGIFGGQVQGFASLRKVCLTILSSREWKVSTAMCPPGFSKSTMSSTSISTTAYIREITLHVICWKETSTLLPDIQRKT